MDRYDEAARTGQYALNAWDRDNAGPSAEDEELDEEAVADEREAMLDAYYEDMAVEDSRGIDSL